MRQHKINLKLFFCEGFTLAKNPAQAANVRAQQVRCRRLQILRTKACFCSILEQTGNLAGLGVDVDAAIGGVGCRAGHHGDGTSHRAEELRAAVFQNVADLELPAFGFALLGGVVGQGQVGLDHHRAVILVLRVGLEALCLLDSQRCPFDAVCTVDFLRDQLDALTQRHFEVVQELDVDGIFASLDNGLCQLDRAFTAEAPVVGLGAADAMLGAELLEKRDFRVGVGVEAVDADDRIDAGLTTRSSPC